MGRGRVYPKSNYSEVYRGINILCYDKYREAQISITKNKKMKSHNYAVFRDFVLLGQSKILRVAFYIGIVKGSTIG